MNAKLNVDSFNKWADSEAANKWVRTKDLAKSLGRTPTWLEVVEENFALDQSQANALKGMPAESSAILQSVAEQMRQKGGKVRVEKTSSGSGRLLVEREGIRKARGQAVTSGIQPSLQINIPIAYCTFDADCTNWNCGWGPG